MFALRLLIPVATLTIVAACARAAQFPKVAPTPAAAEQFSLVGTLEAPECGAGYDVAGAQVIVRNERNEVIASTTTGQPTAGSDPRSTTESPVEVQRNQVYSQMEPIHREMEQIHDKYLGANGSPPADSPDATRLAQLTAQYQQLSAQFDSLSSTINSNTCVVHFTAAVPVAQFYQIRVGTHDAPVNSLDELKAKQFQVELTLK